MAEQNSPEILLCDSSFIGPLSALRAHPERYRHWDAGLVERIDAAILAISVVTLAEARFGYLNAGWGKRKIDEWELRFASFLQIPLDLPDLDEWARLKDLAKRGGIAISDNDLWIAATASTRGHSLVTCDKDQLRLDSHLPSEVIYLARSA
ncbi:MAG TPA: PIN domain-containing protein [Solirubrobacterales bacterium]